MFLLEAWLGGKDYKGLGAGSNAEACWCLVYRGSAGMALRPPVIERSETRVTPPPPPIRVITAHPPSKKTIMKEEETKNRLVGRIIPWTHPKEAETRVVPLTFPSAAEETKRLPPRRLG